MDAEVEYQRIVSFLDQLRSMNESLNDRALMQSYSLSIRAIELHFEKCVRAMALRKEVLIAEVEDKLQIHKKLLEGQRKELKDSIIGCTRILEGGRFLHESNREIANRIWKNVATIEAPKLEEGTIGVKLPELILDVIGNHGTVYCETRRIARSKAGYVTALAQLESNPLLGIPSAVHVDPKDGLYVCDTSSNIIKKISLQGVVTPVTSPSSFKSLGGISIYHKDSILYASDTANHTIKKRSNGFFGSKIETVAGSSTPGHKDGSGTNASFNCPGSLAVDQLSGDIYVADVGNHAIRKITPLGVVCTIAGSGTAGSRDGVRPEATFHFNENTAIWFCENRVLYVCDRNALRLVDVGNGQVSTVPCNINSLSGVVTIADGSILVSSASDNKIFHIKKQEKDKYDVTVLAGSGAQGDHDGPALACKFHAIHGLAFDETTNTCFVADSANHSIKKFTFV